MSACAQPLDSLHALSRTARTVSPGIRPLRHSIAGPVNTVCAVAVSPRPGSARAATIRPGKAGQPRTAQTHYATTPPQITPKRHTQRVALAAVPQTPPNAKSPQNAVKTPLRVGHKNNRPGIAPGRPVAWEIICGDTAGCSIACCNGRGAAHTVAPCGCLRQSVPAARRGLPVG